MGKWLKAVCAWLETLFSRPFRVHHTRRTFYFWRKTKKAKQSRALCSIARQSISFSCCSTFYRRFFFFVVLMSSICARLAPRLAMGGKKIICESWSVKSLKSDFLIFYVARTLFLHNEVFNSTKSFRFISLRFSFNALFGFDGRAL